MLEEKIHGWMINYLSEEIGVEEEQCLKEWRESSAENETLFREFCREWMARRWVMTSGDVVPEKAWMNIAEGKRRRRRMRMVRRVAVAASVILLLGMAGWWIFAGQEESSGSAPEIRGRAVVQLVLSNGETVELGGLDSWEKLRDAGMAIVSDSMSVRYKEEEGVVEEAYNELIVPRGGEYQLQLADGSKIMLNSASRLRYPVNFHGDTREVFLEGEGCFDIRKDTERPFIVRTEQTTVYVTGTLFNVSAYSDDKETEVTLLNGAVEVKGDGFYESLDPGKQLVWNPHTRSLAVNEVNAAHFIAWTYGEFWFEALSLDELLKKLGRWFDVEYEFRDESLKSKRYTGGFRKYDELESILNAISEVYRLSFKITDGKIIIDRK